MISHTYIYAEAVFAWPDCKSHTVQSEAIFHVVAH